MDQNHPNTVLLSTACQVYEEDFKADGQPSLPGPLSGKLPVANYTISSLGLLPSDAAVSANGTIAEAYVTSLTGTSETLELQTYDSNLRPLSVLATDIDTVPTNNGLTNITNVSVSPNADGSFRVFWTVDNITLGGIDPNTGNLKSSSTNYQVYEKEFQSNGQPVSDGNIQLANYTLSVQGNGAAPLGALPADVEGIPYGLFTPSADTVRFDNLDPGQKQAIADLVAQHNQSALYEALGGDDTVTLPDTTTIPTSTGTVAWNTTNWFYAGAEDDKITGGKLADKIDLGEDDDTVYGSPGKDTITGGDGQDTFDYQSGKYANFKDFAPTIVTTQTLNGGEDLGKQDLLKLPGSANDYRFRVTFGRPGAIRRPLLRLSTAVACPKLF